MSRTGPSTAVAFGHEWMSNTAIWGHKTWELTLSIDLVLPTFYTTLNLVLPSSVFSS